MCDRKEIGTSTCDDPPKDELKPQKFSWILSPEAVADIEEIEANERKARELAHQLFFA